jgi:hypothetical protein
MQSRAQGQAVIRPGVRPKTRSRGLTLIEILIALIVMVLGVLGILALFPPALQSGTESMEATNAAILAESVAHSLASAFMTVEEDKTSTKLTLRATMSHDCKSKSTTNRYTFILPPLPVDPLANLEWWHFPSSSSPQGQGVPPAPGDPGSKMTGGPWDPETDDRLFQLGGDPSILNTVLDVQNVNDPTDPLTQFAFSFDVRKVDDMWYQRRNPGAMDPFRNRVITPEEYEAMEKLYEVRIHILRVSTEAGSSTPYRRYITTFTKRIATP